MNKTNLSLSDKYDPSYERELQAAWAGGLIILVWLIFQFVPHGLTRYQFYEYTVIPRILIAIWVYKIAKRQNRDASWCVAGFLAPGVTLIFMGTRRKLRK